MPGRSQATRGAPSRLPDIDALHATVLDWFGLAARPLPWRAAGTTAWGVLVSEVMAQQTPVARVEPVWRRWLERWPTPAALALVAPGEAVRAWERLGYPRRALRLHEAAQAIVRHHGGQVPGTLADLRALPGVGEYTAAAVACFAFGQPVPVVDTNVRRVLVRALHGSALPAPSLTAAERELARTALPTDPVRAAGWNVAAMELGALICVARGPRCDGCPAAGLCRWNLAGRPPYAGPPRRGQRWEGTDRQCRGTLLQVLRDADHAVSARALADAWPQQDQRMRCLDALVADGLVEPLSAGRFALPGTSPEQP